MERFDRQSDNQNRYQVVNETHERIPDNLSPILAMCSIECEMPVRKKMKYG
jgi:hypothetical protein